MTQQKDIALGLAVALAGQVSIGLTPGEEQTERSIAALQVIGMMLLNASQDEIVREVLAMSEHTRITRLNDGDGWRIETV